MAPVANVAFVYVGSNTNFSVYDSVQYAVDELIAPIISISYASCEAVLTANDLTSLEAVMQQAATQGQTVITASGDRLTLAPRMSVNSSQCTRYREYSSKNVTR